MADFRTRVLSQGFIVQGLRLDADVTLMQGPIPNRANHLARRVECSTLAAAVVIVSGRQRFHLLNVLNKEGRAEEGCSHSNGLLRVTEVNLNFFATIQQTQLAAVFLIGFIFLRHFFGGGIVDHFYPQSHSPCSKHA